MNTFRVTLQRSITQMIDIDVHAEDEDSAKLAAISESEVDNNWEDFGEGYNVEAYDCKLIENDEEDEPDEE